MPRNRPARTRTGTSATPPAVLLTTLMTVLLCGASGASPAGRVPVENTGSRAGASAGSTRAGHTAAGRAAEPRFDWPLAPPPHVSRPFDPGESPYGPGHRGIDLVAAPGQSVLAAAEGYVAFAGPVAGRTVVSIEHDGGLRSTYEPVHAAVSTGERVHGGQVIGTVATGHRGCPAAVCLHWGLRRGDRYLDPLRLVRPSPALRLKPWSG